MKALGYRSALLIFLEIAAIAVLSSTGTVDAKLPLLSRAEPHRRRFAAIMPKQSEPGEPDIFGTCSESEFNETLAGLGSQFSAADFEDYCFDDENICEQECADITLQLAVLCNSSETAIIIRAYCGEFGGRYCYEYVFDDEVGGNAGAAVESAVELCGNDSSTCSPNCQSSLQNLSMALGCCFNNFANNSEIPSSNEFETLNSYELWKECGVEVPGLCLYGDEPDDYEYEYFGACTESEFIDALAELDSQVDFQGYCTNVSTICQDECVDLIFQLTELCNADEIAKVYRAYCGQFGGKSCVELASGDEFSAAGLK